MQLRTLSLAIALLAWPAFVVAECPFPLLEPLRTVHQFEGEIVGFDAIQTPPKMLLVFRDAAKNDQERIAVLSATVGGEFKEEASFDVPGEVYGSKFVDNGKNILFVAGCKIPAPKSSRDQVRRHETHVSNLYIADLGTHEVTLFAQNCNLVTVSPSRERFAYRQFVPGRLHHTTCIKLAWTQADSIKPAKREWMEVVVPLDGAFCHLPGTWSTDDRAYAFFAETWDLSDLLDAFETPGGQALRDALKNVGKPGNVDESQPAATAYGDLSKFKSGESAVRIARMPPVEVEPWDGRTIATYLRGELSKSDVDTCVLSADGLFDYAPQVVPLSFDKSDRVLAHLQAKKDDQFQFGICYIDMKKCEVELILDQHALVNDRTPFVYFDYYKMHASSNGACVTFPAHFGTHEKLTEYAALFDVHSREVYRLSTIEKTEPALYYGHAWVGDELWLAHDGRVEAYRAKSAMP